MTTRKINEFTATEIKDMFGIHTDTLKQLNVRPRVGEWKGRYPTHYYNFKKVLAAWYQYQQKTNNPVYKTRIGWIDPSQERVQMIRQKRIMLEMKNDKLAGKQMPSEIVEEALNEIQSNFSIALSQIPFYLKMDAPATSDSVFHSLSKTLVSAQIRASEIEEKIRVKIKKHKESQRQSYR